MFPTDKKLQKFIVVTDMSGTNIQGVNENSTIPDWGCGLVLYHNPHRYISSNEEEHDIHLLLVLFVSYQ